MHDSSNPIDVAIIGGGVSGIYTGWRLLGADGGPAYSNPAPTVHLFEQSDRLGGRLLSLDPPEIPDFKAEFGGMRYLTTQKLVNGLVQHLEIPTRPFLMGGPNNIYYLRGHHFRQKDFANPAKIPYRLGWQEEGKTPGEIIAQAIETIVPGANRLNKEQWQAVRENYKFNGSYLHDLGFWNVIYDVVSNEAFELLVDAGGYNSTFTNWNAAEALAWYLEDFGPGAQYRGFVNGFESLPLTLAAAYVAAGGHVHYEHELAFFDRVSGEDGAALLRLEFRNGQVVYARRLVLALPRRALELLERQGEFMRGAAVRELLCSVTGHPLFKLFLCYRYPWWAGTGVELGRTVTDMPLRQVYYFHSEEIGPTGYNPELRDSLVMASYDDGSYVDFWSGICPEAHRQVRGKPDASRWQRFASPQGMIDRAQRQLKGVHQLEYLPEPYAAGFIDWGQDPYGGGWHSWNIHVKGWEVRERIRQPLADWPVHICGEAYSSHQAWVEGALLSAESMLQGALGMAAPGWVAD